MEVDLVGTLREEMSKKYGLGAVTPPAKVVYILPYVDQEQAVARFIVINGAGRAVEQDYPVQTVKGMEKLIKNLFPEEMKPKIRTWVEIQTARDHVFPKGESGSEYQNVLLFDIVKEIIQYDNDDMKRYLDKLTYDFGKKMKALNKGRVV